MGQHDRVVHRYAVGALARIVAASVERSAAAAAAADDDVDDVVAPPPPLLTPRQRKAALRATMTALRSGDGQAACFATAALRRVAHEARVFALFIVHRSPLTLLLT